MNEPLTFEEFAGRVGTFADTLVNVAANMVAQCDSSFEAYQFSLLQYAAQWLRNFADQAEADARRQSAEDAA